MRLIVGWIALALLAGLNLAMSQLHTGLAPPLIIAASMAAIVALVFMRLNEGLGLDRIFALAGVFWLTIMFALAGADYFTRIVYPVAQ